MVTKKTILFILALALILTTIPTSSAVSSMPITIENNPNIAGFQAWVVIPYQNEMNSDFSNIRFFDNGVEIPYFLASKIDGNNALIWLRINQNSALECRWDIPGDTTSESNGAAVYDFFDDFSGSAVNASKWDTVGEPAVVNGLLIISSPTAERVSSKTTFGRGYTLEYSARFYQWYGMCPVDGGFWNILCFGWDSTNGFRIQDVNSTATRIHTLPDYRDYYHAYRIDRPAVDRNAYYIDWALVNTPEISTCNDVTTNEPILFWNGMAGGDGGISVDYVSVRKYSSVVPTLTAVTALPYSTLNINVYEETDFATRINNYRVSYESSLTSGDATTTDGNLPLYLPTGDYSVRVSADGYYPRWYHVSIPSNEFNAYLPKNTTDVALVGFSLIDYTGQFRSSDTTLKITKILPGGAVTISESEFSASGLSQHYLVVNEAYSLELISDKFTRSAGSYIPTTNDEVSLVVGEINVVPPTTTYGGFNYTLDKTNSSISLNWVAPEGSLSENLVFSVYDKDDSLVYSTNSSTPYGSATYTYANPTEQYKIQIQANTTGGNFSHYEYVSGGTHPIDMQISTLWSNMIAVFLLLLTALCFGYKHASIGAFITAISAAGLSVLGILQINEIILSVIVLLGLLALFRGRI